MPGGGAVRKQRRGKNRAENFEAFDLGNQHAETLAGMRHVLAPKAQHHAGHRRIADFRQTIGAPVSDPARWHPHPEPGWSRRSVNLQLRQPVGGAAVNHRAKFHFTAGASSPASRCRFASAWSPACSISTNRQATPPACPATPANLRRRKTSRRGLWPPRRIFCGRARRKSGP